MSKNLTVTINLIGRTKTKADKAPRFIYKVSGSKKAIEKYIEDCSEDLGDERHFNGGVSNSGEPLYFSSFETLSGSTLEQTNQESTSWYRRKTKFEWYAIYAKQYPELAATAPELFRELVHEQLDLEH